ncbi:MAG: hypothetical protein WDZ93_00045 [Candidatus Paceibacterota bacterium]
MDHNERKRQRDAMEFITIAFIILLFAFFGYLQVTNYQEAEEQERIAEIERNLDASR